MAVWGINLPPSLVCWKDYACKLPSRLSNSSGFSHMLSASFAAIYACYFKFLSAGWKFMMLPAINIKLEIEPFLMLPSFFSSRSRFGLRTAGLSGANASETRWTHWRRLPTSRTVLERNLFNRFQTPMRSTRRIHIIIIGRQRCHLR